MEVKEENLTEEQQVSEKTIPVFTVLKNGAILKNIFVVNSRDFSSPEINDSTVSDNDEVEEILVVGRHPDCDILLTHPSISRFHLEIRSIPSLQKLFVTDLSSVHGTWVTDQRVEPHACVEVKEGDVIRIGGSTRIYRLHWIPLSRAYDIENPFVSPLDAATVMEQEEENRMLDAENLEVAHQSLENTGSGDDGDLNLDETSEGTGSSVPSEDEDTYVTKLMEQEEKNKMLESENLKVVQQQSLVNTGLGDDGNQHLDESSEGTGSSVLSEDEDSYVTTREILLPVASPRVLALARDIINETLQTSTKWDLDVVEAAAENSSSSCSPSKQQSGGYPEGFDCSGLEVAAEAYECDFRGDGGLHLNVMSERMESAVFNENDDPHLLAKETSSFPRDPNEKETLQFTEDVQASLELAINIFEANAENPSSGCSSTKEQVDGCFEASGCSVFELAAQIEILSFCREFSGETEFVAGQVMEASTEPLTTAEIGSLMTGPHPNVMSERMVSYVPSEDEDPNLAARETSSLPIPRDSIESETLWLQEDVQASPELSINRLEANVENSSSGCTPSKERTDGCFDAFELAAEVEMLSVHREVNGEIEFVTKQVIGAADEPLTKADIRSHEENGETEVFGQVIAVSPKSYSQPEPTLEILTEESRGLEGSEFQSEVAIETESDNLIHQKSIGETKAETWSHEKNGETEVSRQVIAVSPNSFSQAEPTLEILTDEAGGLLGSTFLSEVAVETESENVLHQTSSGETKADIQNHEDNGETEVSGEVIAVSPNSFSQAEPALENLTEEAQGLIGSAFQSEVALETESENLLQSNGETKVGSRQASAVSDCLFTGNERLSRIITEDIQSLCSSWQPLPESEVEVPSEIRSELNPAGDQNQKSGMTIKTNKVFDKGSSSCLSEDLNQSSTQSFLSTPNQKPNTELSVGSGRSEESYSQSEIEGEENTYKWSPIPSTLAAETFEGTKHNEELPFDDTESQDNQTPQTHAVKDGVLSEIDSSSTCNIWSRRGKAASVLQIRTNKSSGKQKQIGNQPKDQLHRKQALTVHHSVEKLEPEIFTPDKENLTPSSHMLKRLQDIGDVKDSKSSSKLSGKSSSSKIHSSIAFVTSEAFTEPEIFTPDKENLTPNSHMLKRLREFGDIKETKGSSSKATRKPFFHVEENVMVERKPDLQNSMSSKSKVKKNEPVSLKNKAERTPFQILLENSSSQNQSYTEPSSITSARNNISRGMRSSSLLSDGKNKMKWTIVLDTSSLLDKESRKPLHLLQGLKGTHMVLPRTVLRELNEVKRTRSLLFRRRTEIASSALDWIEECKVNTKWWIQEQSQSEETKATAPTPPVTPQSNDSATFPFSLHWSNNNATEIDSPTSVDQVLECALLYRNRNRDEKLVLLSNDVTLKIKAMAEGVICETAHEFYESLVNPFSERFMWTESAARGRTWSHLDDVVLRERYNNRASGKKSTYNGGGRRENGAAAKGLKLILLHNSHYGHIH